MVSRDQYPIFLSLLMLKSLALLVLWHVILLIVRCWSLTHSFGVINDSGDWTTSGVRYQWHRGLGCIGGEGIYGCALAVLSLGKSVSVIGTPHGDCPLAGFVGLVWAEARFM